MEIESLSRRHHSLSLTFSFSLFLPSIRLPSLPLSLSLFSRVFSFPLAASVRCYHGNHCGTLSSTSIVVSPFPPPTSPLPLPPTPRSSPPFHVAPGSTTTLRVGEQLRHRLPHDSATPASLHLLLLLFYLGVILCCSRVSTATTYNISLPRPILDGANPGAYLICLTTCC